MNPIKQIRLNKNFTINKFAELINSNFPTLKNAEQGNCKDVTSFNIIKKICLQYNDIDEKKLIRAYKIWEKNIKSRRF